MVDPQELMLDENMLSDLKTYMIKVYMKMFKKDKADLESKNLPENERIKKLNNIHITKAKIDYIQKEFGIPKKDGSNRRVLS